MLTLDMASELDKDWRPVVINQIELMLMPWRARLKTMHVRFHASRELPIGSCRFQCEVSVHEGTGQICHAKTEHRDGSIAIRDAVVRVRRGVSRHHLATLSLPYRRNV
jgi:ribosome-associated translation inhibitor RaiA